MRRTFWSLVALMMLVGSAVGCVGSEGEESVRESSDPTTVEETTVVERTVYRAVMEEPEVEEADAILGQRLTLGGVEVRPFTLREDDTFYFYQDPTATASYVESGSGKFVFVDYSARNEGDGMSEFLPEGSVSDSDGQSYASLPSEKMPTENAGGRELDSGEGLASSLVFNVPEDFDPERLTVSSDGEERVVDITDRDISEAEPREYMAIYHLWFNEREYDEIYGLFDPASTQGISEDEWVSYMDGIWGDWFLSYDTHNMLYDDEANAEVEVTRSFYEPSGATTSDVKVQEMIRQDDEWKLVMRQDQVDDVLGVPEYVPEYSVPEESTLPAEQYDPPDPDPDPDRPDRRPRKPGNNGGQNNGGGNQGLPSDGYTPGSEDLDCSDYPGPVIVSEDDPYELDSDDDGTGCEID